MQCSVNSWERSFLASAFGGSTSQVNMYALDMIKEKNIMLIAIANDSGMIVSSTNKIDEGNPFTSIGQAAALNNNDTMVENSGDSVLTVTSPVMGFNNAWVHYLYNTLFNCRQ